MAMTKHLGTFSLHDSKADKCSKASHVCVAGLHHRLEYINWCMKTLIDGSMHACKAAWGETHGLVTFPLLVPVGARASLINPGSVSRSRQHINDSNHSSHIHSTSICRWCLYVGIPARHLRAGLLLCLKAQAVSRLPRKKGPNRLAFSVATQHASRTVSYD